MRHFEHAHAYGDQPGGPRHVSAGAPSLNIHRAGGMPPMAANDAQVCLPVSLIDAHVIPSGGQNCELVISH